MQNSRNELELIKKYEQKGYTESYRVDFDKLIENNSKNSYSASEIMIVAQHRFEGMSNPDDMSILYVLETKDNTKGTFLASYGAASNTEPAEFFNDIPDENISNKENIMM